MTYVNDKDLKNVQLERRSRSRDSYNSLGIPVDNVTPAQAVDRIVDMVSDFKTDQRPRLVATLNVDFIVNSQGFFHSRPKHPELLKILRDADMVTADGFPIVVLGKLVGSAIDRRVTGADLVPALAERFAKEKLSIYFLGGAADSAQVAADKLVASNPGLKIAGLSSPIIQWRGEKIVGAVADDQDLVNEINKSGADLLLLGLGNPKQEVWWQRNRHRLKVPVSIGVGGTFEFIAGTVKRAPEWIQRLNMEWLFRMTQDPKRLIKRYAVGLVKFGLLSLPLIMMRLQERRIVNQYLDNDAIVWSTMWGSRDQIIRTTVLPPKVRSEWLDMLLESLEWEGTKSLSFLDCSKVRNIELQAHQKFYELGQRFASGATTGALIGLNNNVQRSLRFSRVLDVFDEDTIHDSASDLLTNGANHGGKMTCQSYLLQNTTLIYLSGNIDKQSLQSIAFVESLQDILLKRDCVVDLRYVNQMDSGAIAEMFMLASGQDKSKHQVFFSGASQSLKYSIGLLGLPGDLNLINEDFFRTILFNSLESGL